MPRMLRLCSVLVCSLTVFVGVLPAASQTLYGLEQQDGTRFVELVISTGADSMLIGNAAALADSRGMAMDPIGGLMYAINDDGATSGLYTVSLADASTGSIGTFDDGATGSPDVRDLTFDSTGQLWGVSGRFGDDAASVIPIDKSNAMTGTPLVSTTGDRQQAIAYRPMDGQLYVYSSDGTSGPRFLQSIDPGTGTSTPITLSGTGPSSQVRGMVYDPNADLFRLFDNSGNYFTLSPTGVQTDTGNNQTSIYMGLAFDQTTTVPVELMGFSID